MSGDLSVSKQIEAIIKSPGDWRGEAMSQLHTIIKNTDKNIVEDVKWKMPSNPLGVPVWSYDGILCVGNILKKAVRLTFPKGAKIKDPKKLFNARLESKSVRAIDFFEGGAIDSSGLKALILDGIRINKSK